MKVRAHFENHKRIIEYELEQSNSSVRIAVAWINFKEYFDNFLELLKNDVKLSIICSDNWQNRSHQLQIDQLLALGANIRLLKMPSARNHMHHKFAIIDSKTVLNGSFNWSPNAMKSFENLMVIEDAPEQARYFIEEFKKLEVIETSTIRKMTRLKKCPSCLGGKLVNILVFSDIASKHYETSGDIVKVCTDCEFYDNDNTMITNNHLHLLADQFSFVDNESEYEILNQDIFDELNQYINNVSTIHAIGRVRRYLDYEGEDCVQTVILWKNKFVAAEIQEDYEEDFDVHYDRVTYL